MSNSITSALTPPYYAVIFTSIRTATDEGYGAMASAMAELAAQQPGFIGIDSARDPVTGIGITVAYWRDEDSIVRWRENAKHAVARQLGREKWYEQFAVHVAKVERSYEFQRPAPADSV